MIRPMHNPDLLPFFLLLAILLGLILSMSSWLLYVKLTGGQTEATTLELVQTGKLILRCDMPDGTRDIAPALVVGYYQGTWEFTNGYAKSCILLTPRKPE